MWNGKIGALTAKAAVKAKKRRLSVVDDRWVCISAGNEKVSTWVCDWWMKARVKMPTNKKAEPKKVEEELERRRPALVFNRR